MAVPAGTENISAELERELTATPFACSKLTALRGGTTNFIFRGQLCQPLANGIDQVIVKHGEDYVALHPAFKLSIRRCWFEAECLGNLSHLPPSSSLASLVRTPKIYFADAETHTQVQEYLACSVDLKTYCLRHFDASTPATLEQSCNSLGLGLGKWLRTFHDWTKLVEQSTLRETIKGNRDMQALKHTINYSALVQLVDKFPSILSDARGVFEKVEALAKAELQDKRKLQVIHGDFWTGNTLLPDVALEDGVQIPMFIVDWEMCQLGVPALDLGQMIAEMYELTLFKDIKAGLWLVEGLAAGYGIIDKELAYRTVIHVGTHLIRFGSSVPGWGTPTQVEDVVRVGRDLIIKAWHRDDDWFKGHALHSLFPEARIRE